VRSILDGHIVLSRRLQAQGHYPAIDPLNSVSRVMTDVVNADHRTTANRVKDMMVTYREAEDLINIGAYQKGNNPRIDFAIDHIDAINTFLRQDIDEHTLFDETVQQLDALLK
jgi:flagellum-specific ATP synthase